MLRTTDEPAGGDLPLPDTMQALIAARLDTLPADLRTFQRWYQRRFAIEHAFRFLKQVLFGEQSIASDDRLLGNTRPTLKPKFGSEGTIIHLSTLGESRLLRVLRYDAVETFHILQCPLHD